MVMKTTYSSAAKRILDAGEEIGKAKEAINRLRWFEPEAEHRHRLILAWADYDHAFETLFAIIQGEIAAAYYEGKESK
jgi:hypothetical protein